MAIAFNESFSIWTRTVTDAPSPRGHRRPGDGVSSPRTCAMQRNR
jgi:hypothetical protein